MERYHRNERALSHAENLNLKNKSIAIVGLGGLGGYVAESFARLGVKHITLIDDDVFEITNLNRQLNSYPDNLGQSKAQVAQKQLNRVNPDIDVKAHHVRLDETNAQSLLVDHDIIIDCLDNIPTRLTLEAAADQLKLPLIHGAIGGWYGQVSLVMPGSRALSKLYQNQEEKVSSYWGNPVFIVSTVASIQVAEAVKVLIGRENTLAGKLLFIDLETPEFIVLDL